MFVLGLRYFDGTPVDHRTWARATDAALRQLDSVYRVWIDGVVGLAEERLSRPLGPAEGP